jgi:hypothetical protein
MVCVKLEIMSSNPKTWDPVNHPCTHEQMSLVNPQRKNELGERFLARSVRMLLNDSGNREM